MWLKTVTAAPNDAPSLTAMWPSPPKPTMPTRLPTSVWNSPSGLATIGSKIQDAGLNFDPTKYQFGIYGVIIVLVMLVRPQGLIPSARRKRELELGTHDEPAYDVVH